MSAETSTPESYTVTLVLATLRGHCGVPVVLYHGASGHGVDERLSAGATLAVVKHALERGGVEGIRVAPARRRYLETAVLDVLDYYGATFEVSPDDGDWPLGLSGCADFASARKGRATWRYDYPSSWTDDDAYEFQQGLDGLCKRALDQFDECAAVSAALLAGRFDFARSLLQRLENGDGADFAGTVNVGDIGAVAGITTVIHGDDDHEHE